MSGRLRSSEVASAARVHVETLRYHERRGLLPRPERSIGVHRLYPERTVPRLRLIKAAQSLGFTLAEITELVQLCDRPGASPTSRLTALRHLAHSPDPF